mmetsp:Transcript_876/g.1998  ORF Transcript_876/g.1998 Transcript_876/m.1998 type:complete len:203 (+) Transcript_876:174-782(+)
MANGFASTSLRASTPTVLTGSAFLLSAVSSAAFKTSNDCPSLLRSLRSLRAEDFASAVVAAGLRGDTSSSLLGDAPGVGEASDGASAPFFDFSPFLAPVPDSRLALISANFLARSSLAASSRCCCSYFSRVIVKPMAVITMSPCFAFASLSSLASFSIAHFLNFSSGSVMGSRMASMLSTTSLYSLLLTFIAFKLSPMHLIM